MNKNSNTNDGGQTPKNYIGFLDKSMSHIASSTTWYDMLSIVGVFLVASVVFGLLAGLLAEKEVGAALAYVLTFISTIGYVFILSRRRSYITFPKIVFRRVNPQILLAGIIMMFAVSIVTSPLLALMPDSWMSSVDEMLEGGFWAIMTAVVMAPILEEYLFRGVIQSSLIARLGTARGIIVGAAIFGVIHFVPQQVVYAFALGLVLGFVYYMSKSLVTVIALHFINNGIAFLVSMIAEDQQMLEIELLGDGWLYYTVYSIAVLLIVGAIFVVVREIKNEKKRGAEAEILHENN